MSQIYNGSFVLGDTSATTLSAGPGIKLDTSIPGVIGISNDETVLYTNDSPTTGTNIQLSEAASGFENVRVEYNSIDKISNAYNSYSLMFPGRSTEWILNSYFAGDSTIWLSIAPFSSNDYVNYNVVTARAWNMAVNGSPSRSQKALVTKVVGINRKEV